MKIAITQPNFIPWLGYFEMLDWVDLWISLDNVQLVKRSFHVRNRIIDLNCQSKWLTVSISRCHRDTNMNEAKLSLKNWWQDCMNKIVETYKKAKFYNDYIDFIGNILKPTATDLSLASYNTRLIKEIAQSLGIGIKIIMASDIIQELSGTAEEKILMICEKIKPNAYFNFQSGVEAGLYTPKKFLRKGIEFYKQNYIHPVYDQIVSDFIPYLSVIDLIFNQGSNSLDIIRSGRNWEKLA